MSHVTRAWAKTITGAVLLAEASLSEWIVVSSIGGDIPADNALGEKVSLVDVAASSLLPKAIELASGARVSVVASLGELALARAEVGRAARAGLPIVIHAMCPDGIGDVLALMDLPIGILFASRPAEAVDLSLIARRVAEEVKLPMLILHEQLEIEWLEVVQAPSREVVLEMLRQYERPDAAVRVDSAPGHARLAERVSTALSNATRVHEDLTGRRRDSIERLPKQDCPVILVGAGARGDALLGSVESLRARGHDVGAVKLSAIRPFPAERLVRLVGRAQAVVLVEAIEVPLASSSPLAAEVKSAFADAITWAPDFPGIGRVPTVYQVRTGSTQLEERHCEAIVRAVSTDEPGARSFALQDLMRDAAPTDPLSELTTTRSVELFVSTRDIALKTTKIVSAVLSSAVGARPSSGLRARDGGVACDILLGEAGGSLRGATLPSYFDVVAVEQASGLTSELVSRLSPGGHIVVPTEHQSADLVWSSIAPHVRAIAQDRKARIWALPHDLYVSEWSTIGVLTSIALLAARNLVKRGTSLDGPTIEREVGEAVRQRYGAMDATAAKTAGEAARASFERRIEIPRSYLSRDDEDVRTARRSLPPRM